MNELETILNDFCSDIKNTFPEKKDIIDGYNLEQLVSYCNNYYTERTLEIVYKNEKIFATSCFLLPDIDFSQLWNSNISTETKVSKTFYKTSLMCCVDLERCCSF